MKEFNSLLHNIILAISPLAVIIFYHYVYFDYNYILWETKYHILYNTGIYIFSIFSIYYMFGLPLYYYFKRDSQINIYKLKLNVIETAILRTIIPMNIFAIFIISNILLVLPTFSSAIIYILSLLFGLSLSLETRVKNDCECDINFRNIVLKYFSQSISKYFPLIVITSLIVIPIELNVSKIHLNKLFQFVIIALASAVILYIYKMLYGSIVKKIVIIKSRPFYDSHLPFLIPILCIILFQSWEYLILKNNLVDAANKRYFFYFLFFSGLIPIRLLYIIEPSSNHMGKIYSFCGLMIYIVIKVIT
jgi:hypothetical protein